MHACIPVYYRKYRFHRIRVKTCSLLNKFQTDLNIVTLLTPLHIFDDCLNYHCYFYVLNVISEYEEIENIFH